MSPPSQIAIVVASFAILVAFPFGIYWLVFAASISLAVLFKSYFSECFQSLFDAWVQATSSKNPSDVTADGYGHQQITFQTKDTPSPSDGFRTSKRSPLPVSGSYSPSIRQDGHGSVFPRHSLPTRHFPVDYLSKWNTSGTVPVTPKPESEQLSGSKARDESNDHVWEIHRAAMSKARQEGKAGRTHTEGKQVEQSAHPVITSSPVVLAEQNGAVSLSMQRPKRPYVPDTDSAPKRSRYEKYVEFTSKASKRSLEDLDHGQAAKKPFVSTGTPIKVDEMTASLSSSARKPARKATIEDSYVVCKKCKRVDEDSHMSESLLNGSTLSESSVMNVTIDETVGKGKTEDSEKTESSSSLVSPPALRIKIRPAVEPSEEKAVASQKVITSDDLKKDREIDRERYNSFRKAWRKATGIKFAEEPEVKVITPVAETRPVTLNASQQQEKAAAPPPFPATPGIALKPIEKSTTGFSFAPSVASTAVSTAPPSISVSVPLSFGVAATPATQTPAGSKPEGAVASEPSLSQPGAPSFVLPKPAETAVTKPVDIIPRPTTGVTSPSFVAPAQPVTATVAPPSSVVVTSAPLTFDPKPGAGVQPFSFGVGSGSTGGSSLTSQTTTASFASLAPIVTTQANVPATTTAGGFSFGQPVASGSSFAFGLPQTTAVSEAPKPAASSQPPSVGTFSFGANAVAPPSFPSLQTAAAPATTTAAAFPAATSAPTFSFGTQAAAPVTTSGFSSQPFGATVTTTTSLFGGLSSFGAGGFGSQPSTTAGPTATSLSFGGLTAPAVSSSFGSQPSVPAFGAGAVSSASTTFGSTAPVFGGITFGQPPSAASTTTSTVTGTSTTTPAFGFGQNATSPPPFGATSPPAFGVTSPTPAFGQSAGLGASGISLPTVNPAGFSFGGPSLPGVANPFSVQGAPSHINLSEQQRKKRLDRLKGKR